MPGVRKEGREMNEDKKRYMFHFVGTSDTFSTRLADEEREKLFGEEAKQYGFVTFWGEPTVVVNMQNVTFVKVVE